MFMNELIVKYKVGTCHNTVAMSCNCTVLSTIISDLQFITSKWAMSNRFKLIKNITSMKYFYGY